MRDVCATEQPSATLFVNAAIDLIARKSVCNVLYRLRVNTVMLDGLLWMPVHCNRMIDTIADLQSLHSIATKLWRVQIAVSQVELFTGA